MDGKSSENKVWKKLQGADFIQFKASSSEPSSAQGIGKS
jgi:hypothetical protein